MLKLCQLIMELSLQTIISLERDTWPAITSSSDGLSYCEESLVGPGTPPSNRSFRIRSLRWSVKGRFSGACFVRTNHLQLLIDLNEGETFIEQGMYFIPGLVQGRQNWTSHNKVKNPTDSSSLWVVWRIAIPTFRGILPPIVPEYVKLVCRTGSSLLSL